MPSIEVRYLSGETERVSLTEDQPLSVGRHATSDVRIDEDGVGAMHCRITWNGSKAEVASGTGEGVEVNGRLVRRASLNEGDVVRVGSADLVLLVESHASLPGLTAAKRPASPASDIDLAPLSGDELDTFGFQRPRATPAMPSPAPPQNVFVPAEGTAKGSEKKNKPNEPEREKSRQERRKPADEAPAAKNKASGASEKSEKGKADSARDAKKDKEKDRKPRLEDVLAEEPAEGTEVSVPTLKRMSLEEDQPKRKGRDRQESFVSVARQRLRANQRRPGEQEVVRSPFVLTLTLGSAALVLVSLALWLLIGRQSEQNDYDAAVRDLTEGRYSQAVERFEDFVRDYSRNQYTDLAFLGLGRARVEKEISGASPAWTRGLGSLEAMIKENRDRDEFDSATADVRKYAEQIAIGAASSAASSADRKLLEVSNSAAAIAARYSHDEEAAAFEQRHRVAIREAEAAIVRSEVFGTALAEIEKEITENRPIQALNLRRKLIQQYPVVSDDRQLANVRARALEAEKGKVTREDVGRDAVTTERESGIPAPLTLAIHARARTARTSEGRTVSVLAKDACYGVDTVTGEPRWRRVTGVDTPFPPLAIPSVTGLLMFDTASGELVLVDRDSGALIWRQPLDGDTASQPLLLENQLYVPTESGALYQIDAGSGRIVAKLQFSQKVLGGPVPMADGTRIVVAGDESVVYTLSARPLECVAVSFLGQSPGSVRTSLLQLGRLAMLVDNDRAAGATLRVLKIGDDGALTEIAKSNIDGQVHSQPVIRGRELFVPSGVERITAFSVTDEDEAAPLKQIATYEVRSDHQGPLFVLPQADGQMWMAGSALRRFSVSVDALQLDSNQTAVGIATQPPQLLDSTIYVARRLPFCQAVVFTPIEIDTLTSEWRAVLGGKVIASAPGESTVLCVTDAGTIFRVPANRLGDGGFLASQTAELPVPEGLTEPLRATVLGNGRIAVAAGGAKPMLWIIGATGQVEQVPLEAPLQADPVALGGLIVLPLPGKLRAIGASDPVEDYVVPVENDQQAAWTSVEAVSETAVAALDGNGALTLVELRETPVMHLAGASQLSVQQPASAVIRGHDQRILLIEGNQLKMLDSSALEVLASAALSSPRNVWPVGDRAYVDTASGLACFDIRNGLEPLWSVPLEGEGVAGAPLVASGNLYLAHTDGTVSTRDPETGNVRGTAEIGQVLTGGPQSFGERIIVPSLDGSLYDISTIPQAVQ